MKQGWKKAAALALAVVLCLSATACGDTSYIMKAGEITVPTGIYILNEIDAVSEASSHGDFNAELKNPLDNKIEEKTLEAWATAKATQLTQEYLAVEQQFAKEKLTLTEDDHAAITYSVESMWQFYKENYERMGIAQSSYKARMENGYKANALFVKEYGKGGAKEVSEAELKKDLKNNYAQVEVLTFSTTDAEGAAMADDDKKAVQSEAKSYLERAKKGEEMTALITAKNKVDADKAAEGQDIALEPKAEADAPASYAEVIHKGDANQGGTISEALSTMIFEKATAGTPALLSDDVGYHVVLREEVSDDATTLDSMRDTLLFNLKGDEYKESLTEAAKILKPEVNSNAVSTFSISKIAKEVLGS